MIVNNVLLSNLFNQKAVIRGRSGLNKQVSSFKHEFIKGPTLLKEESVIKDKIENINEQIEIKKIEKALGDAKYFEEIKIKLQQIKQDSYDNNPIPLSAHKMDPIFKVQMKRFCHEAQQKAQFAFPKTFLHAFIFMIDKEK